MIITNVRGTLKAGCDVELTQRTVICGPNGSGTVFVVATKSGGAWTFDQVIVEVDASGAQFDLTPTQ